MVDFGQDRGKHRKGLILHINPNLRPSLGHGIELCVGFVRHSKHGVLHHFSRYLAFLCNRLNGTFRNPHILFNGSCDTRRTVQNRVQFFTTKRTRRHCLCKLDHGVALLLGRSTANNKLFVHLFHEGNDLIHIATEGVTGVQAKFRNGGSGVKISGSGTLGGSHDLLFQGFNGTAIIHKQIQSGFGACQFIRNVQHLIDPGDTTSGNGNFLDDGQKPVGGIATPTDGIVEILLFVVGVPDIFFNGITGDQLIYHNLLFLTDPVGTVCRLVLGCHIPPWIIVDPFFLWRCPCQLITFDPLFFQFFLDQIQHRGKLGE